MMFRGSAHHLAVLTTAADKGDIALWNRFVRKEGPSFSARLAGAQLSNLNLNEICLAGADLREADLRGTSMARSNLSNARMQNADLRGADLSGARLIRVDLTEAVLRGVNLTRAAAGHAVLIKADLSEAVLDDADLSNAVMGGAEVGGTSRKGAKMKVKIRPRSAEKHRSDTRDSAGAWIKAREEEKTRRRERERREEASSEEAQERLNRKLGRKKPLFKRIR